ncbi:DsbA family protein [Actinacidiphila glaucinigra]|uniref:DsbA family protein n=1 Tax=Actinacidiphila glaucinigra TaxID=235986 RepID=UPI0036EE1F6D
MSEKNREGKRNARDRLQEQRADDQRRQKRKRTAIVAGSVVGVLVVGAVIGVVVAGSDGSSGAPAVAPAGATGKDKLALPNGASDAPSTLTVYEDFRCPACAAYENELRDTIHGLQDQGQLKVEYHLVRLIDGNLGGSGSLDAANAAACAQDEGKFRAYHDVLYQNQPPENDDLFADKNHLLELAGKVPGLKTPAFTRCVKDGTYDDWVNANNKAFGTAGFNSTPTILLNGGENLLAKGQPNLSADRLKQLVTEANKGKKPGTATQGATPPSASGSPGAPGSATGSAPAGGSPAASQSG